MPNRSLIYPACLGVEMVISVGGLHHDRIDPSDQQFAQIADQQPPMSIADLLDQLQHCVRAMALP